MEKFAVGNSLSPIHLCACTQCVVNIHLVEIYRVIGCIGNWHISIQELHGKFCIACQTQIFYRCKNIRHRAVGLSCLKILLNSVVNRCCRSKNCKQHYGNHAKSFFYHICNKRLYFWFYHKVKKYLLILTYISPISFIRNSLQKTTIFLTSIKDWHRHLTCCSNAQLAGMWQCRFPLGLNIFTPFLRLILLLFVLQVVVLLEQEVVVRESLHVYLLSFLIEHILQFLYIDAFLG